MAIEKVREYFSSFGIENRILEFEVSSATVELAAKALNCAPCRIAKTLSFKVEDTCILIVTAGDAKIDNKKFKEFFHTKAKMLTAEEVVEFTGHAIGGVCPFAIINPNAMLLQSSTHIALATSDSSRYRHFHSSQPNLLFIIYYLSFRSLLFEQIIDLV